MELLMQGLDTFNKFYVPRLNKKVSVCHCEIDGELAVTIEDVWEDDFEIENLLQLLQQEEVITNPKAWKVTKIEDTNGKTYTDTYTTVHFSKAA